MTDAPVHRLCPSCGQGGLVPTGAFLQCDACGLAITAQALARDSEEVAAGASSGDEREPLRGTG